MKQNVYVYRDKLLGAYGAPFVAHDEPQVMKEGVARACLKAEENILKYRDLALYHLGVYDDITGKFDLLAEADKLLDLEDYIRKEKD